MLYCFQQVKYSFGFIEDPLSLSVNKFTPTINSILRHIQRHIDDSQMPNNVSSKPNF